MGTEIGQKHRIHSVYCNGNAQPVAGNDGDGEDDAPMEMMDLNHCAGVGFHHLRFVALGFLSICGSRQQPRMSDYWRNIWLVLLYNCANWAAAGMVATISSSVPVNSFRLHSA